MIKLAILENKRIEFINDLSPSEINRIIEQTDILYEFDRDTAKFRLFKDACHDFNETLYNETRNKDLSRKILELMSTFRAFLDNWETYLKRKYGKDTEPINAFKSATKVEYDNVFAYRFIYELRNFIQHVGQPNFRFHSSINETNEIQVNLFLNKSDLLSNYDKWKQKVKDDFKTIPETFDFVPLVNDLFKSVKTINDVAMNLSDIKALYETSLELYKLNRYRQNKVCDIAIIEGEWNKPMPQELKIRVIPMWTVEYVVENVKIIQMK